MGDSSKKPPESSARIEVTEPEPEQHDVLMLTGGRTEDGEGIKALRARPEKLELAELRPIKGGKPLGDGELVSLHERKGSPVLWDVKSEYGGPDLPRDHDGPVRVSTDQYREGWEAVFGKKKRRQARGKKKGKAELN